jgi:hypothetical protein
MVVQVQAEARQPRVAEVAAQPNARVARSLRAPQVVQAAQRGPQASPQPATVQSQDALQVVV